MDPAALLELATGLGVQTAVGFFVPILTGFVSVVSMLATLFFYADKSSDYNQFVRGKDPSLDQSKFDFIVVGAGSAGNVVANRLSAHFNVLLLERGGEPNPLTRALALQPLILSNPEMDYMYPTVPQNSSCFALNNRQSIWNSGRGLGGGSMVNSMIYIRGHPFDYNRWAMVTKDDRWKYENILPYFLRSEGMCNTCENPSALIPTTNPKYHNTKGELSVRPMPFSKLVPEFLEALKWAGVSVGDLNAPYYEPTGDTNWQLSRNGRRMSTYHSMIAPLISGDRKRQSLTVIKHARVIQVLFDSNSKSNQVIGVKYKRFGKIFVAKANKEVILSAGSIATPKILLSSGIGPAADLHKLDLPCRANLPVGKNLQDHVATFVGPFLLNKPGVSVIPERDLNSAAVQEYLQNGTGPFTTNWIRATTMWTSSRALHTIDEAHWPDIHIHFTSNGISQTWDEALNRQYNIKPDVSKKFLDPIKGRESFSFIVDYGRPKSRGEIQLKSTNYEDEPLINPRYYEDPEQEDIGVMVEALQRLTFFAENAPSFKRLGARLSPIPLPTCKHHLFRSAQYWECFARSFTFTMHHFTGSASMGSPHSPDSVVDSELRVIGVKGLRVMDASVQPHVVSTNTNAATIMIAERGAQFVIDQHLH